MHGKNPVWFVALVSTCLAFVSVLPAQTVPLLTTLHRFSVYDGGETNTDGSNPVSLVLGSDGNLYGTAYRGGANGTGTVYQVMPDGQFTVVYTFSALDATGSVNADGAFPGYLFSGRDGNLYGVTGGGGAGSNGTIFRLGTDGTYTSLHQFSGDGSEGTAPGMLLQASDGSLYGTAHDGGVNDGGTIFQLSAAGTFAVLHNFSASSNGSPTTLNSDGNNPTSLVEASDGNFLGTASNGGKYNGGTAFQITSTGALTTLHDFMASLEGTSPSSLFPTGDGNFYGLTSGDSANGGGVIFRLTPAGALTVVYDFNGYEITDASGLLFDASARSFYGESYSGDEGVLFHLTAAGELTTLHQFTGGADGLPGGGTLVQTSDGSIYGTTYFGGLEDGVNGHGTVFLLSFADSASVPTVTAVKRGSGTVVDGGSPGVVFVQRTGDTSTPLTVFYEAKGSAEAALDYKPLSGYVTIPSGQTHAKIKVKPTGEETVDGVRVVRVKLLGGEEYGYNLGAATTVKIKIIKND